MEKVDPVRERRQVRDTPMRLSLEVGYTFRLMLHI